MRLASFVLADICSVAQCEILLSGPTLRFLVTRPVTQQGSDQVSWPPPKGVRRRPELLRAPTCARWAAAVSFTHTAPPRPNPSQQLDWLHLSRAPAALHITVDPGQHCLPVVSSHPCTQESHPWMACNIILRARENRSGETLTIPPSLSQVLDRRQQMATKKSILLAAWRAVNPQFFDYVLGRCATEVFLLWCAAQTQTLTQ